MSTDFKRILFGEGLGDIKFGMSREQLRDLLGEPDEIDQFSNSESEGDKTESWHYDATELSVSFDEEVKWKLSTIAVSTNDFEFNNEKLIGSTEETLINLLKDFEVGEIEKEVFEDEELGEQILISAVDQGANFWFEGNTVSEIQWTVLWEDENTPEWP